MAKTSQPSSSPPPGKRPRGRPPKPGGRIPQAEVQRAYRARLAAAGKVVRLIDAAALTSPSPAAVPGFDPETQGIYDRAMIEDLRERLKNALSKLQLREEEVARLSQRNASVERELKIQEQHNTNSLKETVMLKHWLGKR